MKKTKKLLKRALKNPELFTEAELAYFRLIKDLRRQKKDKKRQSNSLN